MKRPWHLTLNFFHFPYVTLFPHGALRLPSKPGIPPIFLSATVFPALMRSFSLPHGVNEYAST